MLSVVYGCSGILIHFIITMMLANYVFLISPMKNRFLEWLYRLGACAVCLATCVFTGAIPSLITLGLSIGGYIFFTMAGEKQKDYFSILQLFPIMGLSYGLIMPLKQIPVIFLKLGTFGSKVYSIFLYSMILIMMLLFVIRGQGVAENVSYGVKKPKFGTVGKSLALHCRNADVSVCRNN